MTKGFAIYNSLFGYFRIDYEDDVIIFLKKIDVNLNDKGKKTEFTDNVYKQVTEYFNGDRKSFDFKYRLTGTEFQLKVWNELLKIPYGETRSYKEIAIGIGNEKASRAVGMANNKTHHPIKGLHVGIAAKGDVKIEANAISPMPIPLTMAVIFRILIPASAAASSSWETARSAIPIFEYQINKYRIMPIITDETKEIILMFSTSAPKMVTLLFGIIVLRVRSSGPNTSKWLPSSG